MMVGAISEARGTLAIAREEPGHRRLFKCRALICVECGAASHGVRSVLMEEPTHWEGTAPPILCFACGAVQPMPRTIDTHYHLAAPGRRHDWKYPA